MGRRGPLPKKRALKVLSGQLPVTAENVRGLCSVSFDEPPAPEGLNESEMEVWRQTVALLRPHRILEKIDGAVLAAYCCSFVRWQSAEKLIKKAAENSEFFSLVSQGAGGGYVINPLVNISRRSQADMINYAAQLGMTPAARMRVSVEKPKEDENQFKKLKQGKNDVKMGTKGKKVRKRSIVKKEQKPVR